MARSRGRILLRHWLEYAAARAALAMLGHTPLRWMPTVGRWVGRVAQLVLRRNVRVARENLRRVFGEGLAPARRDKIIADVFTHLGLMAVELARLTVEPPGRLAARVDVSGARPMLDWARAGKPMLLVTLHYGNWEIMGPPLAEVRNLAVMARPLDNPLLDRFLNDIRVRAGHGGHAVVSKRGGLRELLRRVRAGHICGMVIDQDARRHGVWAPLLGTPASTPPTVVQIALRRNLPLFVIAARRRTNEIRHELFTLGPIWLENTGDAQRDVRVGVARVNRLLERIILTHPGQWFGWIHRRWKTPLPPGEPVYDADGNRLEPDPAWHYTGS